MKSLLFIPCLLVFNYGISQTVSDLINEVDLTELTLTLNEFSGEVATVVDGNTVTILNRVSNTDNNLAAEYLLQKLNAITGITVTDNIYSPGANGGRNVIATQIGQTNPNNIYIVCAHYDSVANYCADDNVSGTAAVLELARILSQYNFDNTIVYALWDQEEIGLFGANNYAEAASAAGDNILGVLNMDMMGYENDGDNEFDIDVRDIGNSIAMKNDIISTLNTYKVSNDINLTANVVNPGTPQSDHKPFWDEGYSAVLLGEAWSTGDRTPHWHNSNDKVATMDLNYYHDMVKLAMAYTATKAGLNVLSVADFDGIEIKLFPNPMRNTLHIKSSEMIETEISIMNINGKNLQEREISRIDSSIDVSQLSSGIYFIKLKNRKGERIIKMLKN